MTLRDPDVCKFGHTTSEVLSRWRGKGYLRRRHRCRICGHRWTSYQSLMNPRTLTVKASAIRYP